MIALSNSSKRDGSTAISVISDPLFASFRQSSLNPSFFVSFAPFALFDFFFQIDLKPSN
jgi:hypothetical protein